LVTAPRSSPSPPLKFRRPAKWIAARKKLLSTSAQLHGAPFGWFTLPNLKLSLIAAALLIFTLSMDEIAVTFFLYGREYTLPLEIWGRLRRGITLKSTPSPP